MEVYRDTVTYEEGLQKRIQKKKKNQCGICNILIQAWLKYSGPEHMNCKKSSTPQPVPMQTALTKLSGAHTEGGLKKTG